MRPRFDFDFEAVCAVPPPKKKRLHFNSLNNYCQKLTGFNVYNIHRVPPPQTSIINIGYFFRRVIQKIKGGRFRGHGVYCFRDKLGLAKVPSIS